tara:strand:- start:602 stop:961 length:360 start_codon:yes stop_codon:yes gene_type:complete
MTYYMNSILLKVHNELDEFDNGKEYSDEDHYIEGLPYDRHTVLVARRELAKELLVNPRALKIREALKDASISIATAQDDMKDGVLKMLDLEDIQDHITRLENLIDPVPFTNGRDQGVTS